MTTNSVLPDVLATALDVVFCGTAAGERSGGLRAYYAGPGNAFWTVLHAIGLTPRQLTPAQFRSLLSFGIGLTDIAKCRSGNDDILCEQDFDVAEFRAKIVRYAPRFVAFNGKRAAAVFYGCETKELQYGPHDDRIGDTRFYVLPSTSGSARRYWDPGRWQELAEAVH